MNITEVSVVGIEAAIKKRAYCYRHCEYTVWPD